MEPIVITKDIEKFLRMIENIYNDIFAQILKDIKQDINYNIVENNLKH